MGRNKFTRDIKNMLSGSTCWECVDNYGFNTYNSGIPEPMILEYNLTSWKRAGYKGSDADLICTPDLDNSMKYRGLLKK